MRWNKKQPALEMQAARPYLPHCLNVFPCKEHIMSDESPIIFTDSCCAKVADLIAEEINPDLMLRVFVKGGGCSGFKYGFTFD